jgi:hypothetical protein
MVTTLLIYLFSSTLLILSFLQRGVVVVLHQQRGVSDGKKGASSVLLKNVVKSGASTY